MPSNFTGSARTLPAPVPPRRPRSAHSERGVVLVWAAAVTLIVAGVVIAGTDRIKAVDDTGKAEFSAQGQAHQVAEAGLVDAYAWFRRQQVQPVATFAPRRNLAASPPVNETDDATQGLLRTFEISPGLWARYRVQAGAANEPYVDGNVNGHFDVGEAFTDVDGNGRWTPAHDTRDVTIPRGLPGVGTVWEIVSRAQVFRRPRADLDLGVGENVQVAEATLSGGRGAPPDDRAARVGHPLLQHLLRRHDRQPRPPAQQRGLHRLRGREQRQRGACSAARACWAAPRARWSPATRTP